MPNEPPATGNPAMGNAAASSAAPSASIPHSLGSVALSSPRVGPMGLAAPAQVLLEGDREAQAVAALAAKILEDPIAMHKLGERLFQMLQADLMIQRERSLGYGRRRP